MPGAEPVDAVQALDQLLQVARFFQAGLRVGVDGGDQRVVAGRELEQGLAVVVQQVQAALVAQLGPAGILGSLCAEDAALGVLVLHLDEEQQHQLGDVVAVVDAVVAQHVAEVPELLDDVLGCHI